MNPATGDISVSPLAGYYSAKLFRNAFGTNLYGSDLIVNGLNRLNVSTNPPTLGVAVPSSAFVGAVLPSKGTVLDDGSSGIVHQYDAISMVDTGINYPGIRPAVSQSVNPIVVTSAGNMLTAYPYGNSGQILRTFTVSSAYSLVAYNFAPNSSMVWAILRQNSTGYHLFGQLFDAQQSAALIMPAEAQNIGPEEIAVTSYEIASSSAVSGDAPSPLQASSPSLTQTELPNPLDLKPLVVDLPATPDLIFAPITETIAVQKPEPEIPNPMIETQKEDISTSGSSKVTLDAPPLGVIPVPQVSKPIEPQAPRPVQAKPVRTKPKTPKPVTRPTRRALSANSVSNPR
jgi:hypothetical protein